MMPLRVGTIYGLPSDQKRDRKERRLVRSHAFLLSLGKDVALEIAG